MLVLDSIVALSFSVLAAVGLSFTDGAAGARGASVAAPVRAAAPRPSIPPAAAQYERAIKASAYRVFGLNAPVAMLAAQLHQESTWNANARSPVGALGLAQFMPATGRDLARTHPAECAPYDPLNPEWAIRCQHRYLHDLMAQVRDVPGYLPQRECANAAFGLSAYNGGLGWVNRDRAKAQRAGRDPNRWFGHVESTADPRRAARFVAENRGYPRRILLTLQARYVAGWNARGVPCT